MSTTSSLKTEDTGKVFEMAICLAYGIPYDGPYKYGLERPLALKARLSKLPELFPKCTHTAKRGARYDYTADTDPSQHLSAKTTKHSGGKVAPQVVGQAQPQKFAELLGIPYSSVPALKEYIQTHPTTILPILTSYTFDCPNIYYNEHTDAITFLTLIKPIDWTKYTYSWTKPYTEWANSSTLKIQSPEGPKALLEIQFHSASRTNMAVRWCYETFLDIFKEHFTMHKL
jgi:hypothetical protein